MKVVIDANIALALVIPLPYSAMATDQMRAWQNDGAQLFVPTLWAYEVITAVRKSVIAKVLSPESAIKASDYLFALEIQQIPFTTTLYRNIFDWSVRLNHSQAYDAVYLALAEHYKQSFGLLINDW